MTSRWLRIEMRDARTGAPWNANSAGIWSKLDRPTIVAPLLACFLVVRFHSDTGQSLLYFVRGRLIPLSGRR